ncbi:MAG: hypothetical protein U9M94_03905 [Patescibacteria group bacterium]|nr:hypothetical protein [Patescibacteria group bacterium]
MDKIKKILKKILKIERKNILRQIKLTQERKINPAKIKKIKGSKNFRICIGRFRILFYWKKDGSIALIDMCNRDENTYKNLK